MSDVDSPVHPAARIVLAPPRWWLLAGLAMFVPCLVVAILAPMSFNDRLGWLALGTGFPLLTAWSLRSRVVFEDDHLSVRGFGWWRTVSLATLISAQARCPQGRFWQLTFRDAQDRHIDLSLTGFQVGDRRQLLNAIAPMVLSPNIDKRGPVDELIKNDWWWPRQPRESSSKARKSK